PRPLHSFPTRRSSDLGQCGIERKEAGAVILTDVVDEADPLCVEDVVSTVEAGGSCLGRLEEIAERRHRTIVEVRRPCPDAVERMVGVADGLPKMREPILGLGVKGILVYSEGNGVRIEAVRIRPDRL